MLEVLWDALKDSLIIFPFVFLIYILMEIIESARKKEKIEKALAGRFAPLFASATGIVPECGFSVMCAKLFDNGYIAVGTLIAAFVASSDEGLIVMITGGARAVDIVVVVAFKLVYACLIGIAANVLLKKLNNVHQCVEDDDCTECGEKHGKAVVKFVLHPLTHALKTFVYIFIVNFAIGTIIYFIGEQNFDAFLVQHAAIQPLVTPLLGLVPNCASSVILAQSFNKGILTVAGITAGLVANAGIGLTMLYKSGRNWKKNIVITVILYLAGVAAGYILLPFYV